MNNRREADKRTCHNCGKVGHLAAKCKAAKQGAAGGKVEQAVKDMVDQVDGGRLALADAVKESTELKLALGQAESKAADLGGELADRKANVALDVRKACEGFTFALSSGPWRWWHVFLRVLYWFVGETWTNFGIHVRFAGMVDRNDWPDLRPDANSLQKVKHQHPILARVELWKPHSRSFCLPGMSAFGLGPAPVLEKRTLTVSLEMVAQLTAPKFMTLQTDRNVVFARIVRAAETMQLVNFDRFDVLRGSNVPMDSALLVYLLYQKYHEENTLDFVEAPRV
jgi:hypothetical protein